MRDGRDRSIVEGMRVCGVERKKEYGGRGRERLGVDGGGSPLGKRRRGREPQKQKREQQSMSNSLSLCVCCGRRSSLLLLLSLLSPSSSSQLFFFFLLLLHHRRRRWISCVYVYILFFRLSSPVVVLFRPFFFPFLFFAVCSTLSGWNPL